MKGRTNKDENCQPNQKKGKIGTQMHIKMKYGHKEDIFIWMNADYMATAGNYRELYSLKTNCLQLGLAFMTQQQSSKRNELPCCAHSPPKHAALQPACFFCLIPTFTFLGPWSNTEVRGNALHLEGQGETNF